MNVYFDYYITVQRAVYVFVPKRQDYRKNE